MIKVKKRAAEMEVKRLEEGECHVISMVKHGAARIPFRILKSEDEGGKGMKHINDLSFLFGARTQKSEAAVIGAVAVPKGSDLTAISTQMGERGMTVLKQDTSREDVDLLVVNESVDLTKTVVVKMHNDTAVMVAGAKIKEEAKKSFSSWSSSTDFNEMMKIEGFFPSVRMASNVLDDTIYNIMWSEDNNPSDKMGKALKAFSAYVMGLVDAIPSVAFKAETMVVTKAAVPTAISPQAEDQTGLNGQGGGGGVGGSQDGPSQNSTEAGVDASKATGDITVPAAIVADNLKGDLSTDTTKVPVAKAVNPATVGPEGETKSPEELIAALSAEPQPADSAVVSDGSGAMPAVQPATTPDFTSLIDQLRESFVAPLKELSAKMDSLSQEVATVKETATQAKEAAVKSEEALGGMVLNTDLGGDPTIARTTTRKSDRAAGVFDSALHFPGLED